MNKLKYILIALLLLTSELIWAQTVILTGKVYEMVNGKKEPAVGVNVVVANSQNRFLTGTTTTITGDYNLRIPTTEKGLNIVYSFIGMKSQKVEYTGQQNIEIVLESDAQLLDEVTITERRIERSYMGLTDKEQTTATQRVTMDDIMESSPVTSVEEALQGQLGGVDIVTSADPGARSSIRIRGTSTLNTSAEPLIVIDGIPYNTTIEEGFDFSTANEEDFGQMLNINPADIESIEVLKDASATAIWGTQGANGVLMIKLKKGAKGKTRFTFSSKFTAKFQPSTIPMLDGNQYVALMQDAIWNTANAQGLQSSITLLELLFNTPEINYRPDWRYFNEYNQNTNWLDEVEKNAFTTDNNFSMAGGGDKATYRFSLGYLDEGGTTIGTGLKRLTTNLNVNYNFSTRLRVDADFSYTQSDKEANYTNVRSEALNKMPNKSPYWIDPVTGKRTSEYFNYQPATEFQGAFESKDGKEKNYNPVAMANEGYNDLISRESKITFRLNYDILQGFSYNGWVSMRITSNKTRKFLPQVATGVIGTDPFANRSSDLMSDNFALQTENKLIYRKNWNDMHNLVATGVLRTQQSQSSSYSSVISGAPSAGLADPTTGGSPAARGSGTSEARSMSGILSLHYTLFNKYMFSTTVNAEGNSSMGKSERWGYFPAFGLGWQLHEESFLVDKEWLEQAKIRIGYGQSGGSPKGAAPYLGTFKAVGRNYMDMAAIAPVSIQLNNLKWQTSEEYNVGADLTFLKGKLNFTFDYYDKTTKDLLQKDVKIPASTGFTQIAYFNSGEIRNWGLEFRADYEIFKNKDWTIKVNANVSRNVNEIKELPENISQEPYTFGNGNYAQRLGTGVPVGSFYGYKYKGVYQNIEETYARDANNNIMRDVQGAPVFMHNGGIRAFPGDAIYEDMNYDGIINQYDIVYIGNGMPVLTGGGGFNIKYRNSWTLSALFHGRAGQKVINTARMDRESMHGRTNQSTAVLKRWRAEGDNTDIPRALYNYGYNYLGSDRFVENASYLRLKQVSLNYSIPKAICQRWGITSLSFFITGYDLLTWTDYTGQDPEVSLPSSVTGLVKDGADTPRAKRFACGVNINF